MMGPLFFPPRRATMAWGLSRPSSPTGGDGLREPLYRRPEPGVECATGTGSMTAERSSEGSPPWVGRARARLERWRKAGLGPRWVVAVSGGSDSVGLLRLLHTVGPRLGLELSVAHLDHGARGDASAEDA